MGNLIWMVVDFSAPYSLMNCSGEIVMSQRTIQGHSPGHLLQIKRQHSPVISFNPSISGQERDKS